MLIIHALKSFFGGNDAYREALIVDAEEFIGVKSSKAKGKRLTTFEVETINELEPLRFAPEVNESAGENSENDDSENEGSENEATNEIEPKDSGGITEQNVQPKVQEIEPKKDQIENDSVLPDEIIDQKRLLDDITGQLTLF